MNLKVSISPKYNPSYLRFGCSITLSICLISFLTFSLGCNKKKEGEKSSPTTDVPVPVVPPEPPPVADETPMAIKVYSQYEGASDGATITYKFTETGTDTCSSTTAAPIVSCTVKIPEGRLYFSKLGIAFSYMQNEKRCRLTYFTPYQYRISTSSTYSSSWTAGTTADCTKPNIACWGGFAAATGLRPSASTYYYPPNINEPGAKTDNIVAASAWKQERGSNRVTVNDLPVAKQSNAYSSSDLGGFGDGLIAGTYVDYTFVCRDDWSDPLPYKITLYITEEDSATGNPVLNHHYTWKELP